VVSTPTRVLDSSSRATAARTSFVHISAVERSGMNGLNEGQKINYEIATERGRSAAVNLKAGRIAACRSPPSSNAPTSSTKSRPGASPSGAISIPGETLERRRGRIRGKMNVDRVPVAFVALDDAGGIVGTASPYFRRSRRRSAQSVARQRIRAARAARQEASRRPSCARSRRPRGASAIPGSISSRHRPPGSRPGWAGGRLSSATIAANISR